MLPKPLYESLPYFSLVTGALSVVFPTDILQAASGLLLYWVGAFVWIIRSQHRRIDNNSYPLLNANSLPWHKTSHLPEPIYEAMPFIYILSGSLILRYSPHLPAIFAGFTLLTLGLTIWTQRHISRSTLSAHSGFIKL